MGEGKGLGKDLSAFTAATAAAATGGGYVKPEVVSVKSEMVSVSVKPEVVSVKPEVVGVFLFECGDVKR